MFKASYKHSIFCLIHLGLDPLLTILWLKSCRRGSLKTIRDILWRPPLQQKRNFPACATGSGKSTFILLKYMHKTSLAAQGLKLCLPMQGVWVWSLVRELRASQVALVVKNPPANAGDMRLGFDPWARKIPWRRARQPSLVFLPGESHGQRSLVGYSP